MRAPLPVLALPLALNLACAAQAQGAGPDPLDFFAGQGCAIGPATRAAARQAGLEAAAIDALAEAAAGNPGTIRTGDWLVLPPDMCRMRPPDIESEIALTDPEVAASITPIDEYESLGGWGCFLDMDRLLERLPAERGWSKERAYAAYRQLVAGGLARGELAFFSTDPLVTPWGIQVVTGDCGADLPDIDLIRADHDHLVANFDAIIRASAVGTECTYGAIGTFFPFEEDKAPPNVWTGFQAMLITLGAGWQEGISLTEKGVPRPPLCQYPAAR